MLHFFGKPLQANSGDGESTGSSAWQPLSLSCRHFSLAELSFREVGAYLEEKKVVSLAIHRDDPPLGSRGQLSHVTCRIRPSWGKVTSSAFANFGNNVFCLFVFRYYWELNHVLVEISAGWIIWYSHFCSEKESNIGKIICSNLLCLTHGQESELTCSLLLLMLSFGKVLQMLS